MMQKPLPPLTGLRIFAALLTVGFHVRSFYFYNAPQYIQRVLKVGFIGVNIFFVLSGFILGYQYFDRKINKKDFFIARFARIYPVYALGLLLTIGYIAHGTKYLPAIIISNLVLMQAWTPWSACVWNCQGWSLSAEAFFYLIFPIAMLIILKLRGKKVLAGWGIICGLIALIPIALIISGKHNQLSDTELNALQYTPLIRLPEFILGILTAKIFKDGLLHLSKNASITMIITIATAIAIMPKGFNIIFLTGGIDILLAFLILALATREDFGGKILGGRWLCLLGESSYALYILHVFLFNIVHKANIEYFKIGRVFEGGIFLGVSLLISIAVYKWYEKPVRNYIRNRFIPYKA